MTSARFRIDPSAPGAYNMEEDLRLLEAAETSLAPMTVIRIYGWEVPTLSVGRFQEPGLAANLPFCRAKGIPIVVRPTGGRAVFHCDEVTYSVVSNDRRLFAFQEIAADYQRIALALQNAFGRLGIESTLAPSRPGTRSRSSLRPCFLSPARYELLVDGKKLAGSAQRRLRRSFLQHGSIPLKIDYSLAASVLGVDEPALRRGMTSVSESAQRDVSFDEFGGLLLSALADVLRLELVGD